MKAKIKTWSELSQTLGLDSAGRINCFPCMTAEMEEILPADRVITGVKAKEFDGIWYKGFCYSSGLFEEEV